MSVKKRMMLSVAVIALLGAIAAVTVGLLASVFGEKRDAIFQKSLTAVVEAGTVEKGISAANSILTEVIAMTHFVELSDSVVAFDFEVSRTLDGIEMLHASAQSSEMTALVDDLSNQLAVWVEGAHILLGAKPASAVPQFDVMMARLTAIQALASSISSTAQSDARSMAEETARVAQQGFIFTGAILATLMVFSGIYSWNAARKISSSVASVAKTLRVMANGQESHTSELEDDELLAMQNALEILKVNLAEKDDLADRELKVKQDRHRRANVIAAFQADLQNFVGAAECGDFSVRMSENVEDDDMQHIAKSMNALISGIETAVSSVSDVLRGLAAGNLSVRMMGEFSGVFENLQADATRTCHQLSDLMAQISNTSDEIRNAIESISSGSDTLSERSATQGVSIKMTSKAMADIQETVAHNAEGARSAGKVAGEASGLADKGVLVAGEAIQSINLVDESAKKISEITSLVDGIAFQTNLLALNAAVEAARAGEAGKGFAVVASEVRNLAQRASDASSDIKNLIEASSQNVAGSVQHVTDLTENLTDIQSSISQASEAVSQIVDAVDGQTTRIEAITGEIKSLEVETSHNVSLAGESAKTAKTLSEKADDLSRLIAIFQDPERQVAKKVA